MTCTRLATTLALLLGYSHAQSAVTIYEVTGPNDAHKYAARAGTRAEADSTARKARVSSNEQFRILGGCDRPGWYGHVIFFPTFGKEASFAACGFQSRDELLVKLKTLVSGAAPFRSIKNVVSLYDDGKPEAEGLNNRDKRIRFKGFGCLAYSESDRFWLEYQPSGDLGERSGRFVVASDGSTPDAVLRCHPKFAPPDTVPKEIL